MPARSAPALLILLASLLTACTSSPPSVQLDPRTGRALPPPPPPAPAAQTQSPQCPVAFSTTTGLPMGIDSLAARAALADIVIIGETHNDTAGQHHAATLAARVFEARRSGTLALEFVERDQQIYLDDFANNLADRPALLAALTATNRADTIVARTISGTTIDPATITDVSLPAPHADMLEHARDHDINLVAANAPRRYVRLIRSQGPGAASALSTRQRATFTLPDQTTPGDYRDRFFAAMSHMTQHGDAGKRNADVEALYLAQNVWDATMADSVVNAAQQGHTPVVLVVGRFHTDFNGGLVQRIRQQLPDANIYTVSYDPSHTTTLNDADRDRADAVVYTAPPPAD